MPNKGKRSKAAKPKPSTKDPVAYLIKGIDADVYERFKARAAANGQELKFLFHRFIREFADGAPTV